MKIRFTTESVARWFLIGFFLISCSLNIFSPKEVALEYQRWGFPDWFHYVTGAMELSAALLLAGAKTRLIGIMLGAIVASAAILTVVLHGEYGHALIPLALLVALISFSRIVYKRDLEAEQRG
ncbi:DoxX family protein [Caballeronia sp. J97]|uniref:DoxX family protein n=1 Tax=Caballeronia sp. J97 TaxID=2805429 RepID=UPI002AB2A546|nr:DoxX family protein [Caballeronia sp. J97]